MTPKKCMSIAKSLTDTQHMELEPLCALCSVHYSANFGMQINTYVLPALKERYLFKTSIKRIWES